MNLAALVTDNITELLVKIIEFTQTRQKILAENINNMYLNGYVPKDLAVDEFSQSLNHAVAEHCQYQRLILCDSENISFGMEGTFEAKPVNDRHAAELLHESTDAYLELQIDKLLENSINQRLAAELFKQKQGAGFTSR